MWSLAKAKIAILVAGCLAMAYTQLTLSPATIEFARSLGASGWHFGVLGALPTGMLFMQLIAAVVVNHVTHRKRLWMTISIVQRLACVPAAFGPWLLPQVPDIVWIWVLIGISAANYGLLNFATPLWLSWMADYLPRDGLSHYWGRRQAWMQWMAAVSLLFGAMFFLQGGLEIRPAYALLIGLGALLGVGDILLFSRVEEPPVHPLPEPRLWEVLSGPFRDRQFRRFIGFSCFWNFSAMVGAPFISLYLLGWVGMDLYHVLLLWTVAWVGGALFSGWLGHLTERHGQRPVLILCTAFKSSNMIALLLIPPNPLLAFWVLVPVFMVDAVLNAGIAIANNGFLLKNSPSRNRTMFIAAGLAFAGMAGGLASIAAGLGLETVHGVGGEVFGGRYNGFHLLFGVSLTLRLVAAVLALRLEEEDSHGTRHVVMQLIGTTPLRMLRFPLGFYRRWRPSDLTPEPLSTVLPLSRNEAAVSG